MSVLCSRRATAPIEMAMEELVGITDPDGILRVWVASTP
jgi:hypothetical protein